MNPQGWQAGDVVRKRRKARKWTIARLAQASGLNKATISAIENGSGYQSETLARLLKALDLETTPAIPPVATSDAGRGTLLTIYDDLPPDYQIALVHAAQEIAQVVADIRLLIGQVDARAGRARNDADQLRTLRHEVRQLRDAVHGRRTGRPVKQQKTG